MTTQASYQEVIDQVSALSKKVIEMDASISIHTYLLAPLLAKISLAENRPVTELDSFKRSVSQDIKSVLAQSSGEVNFQEQMLQHLDELLDLAKNYYATIRREP